MPSWIVAPSRSTPRARPRTSRAGWIAAQCGVYVATERVRRVEVLASLGRVEQPQVLGAEAPGTPLVDLGCRAPQLQRRAGEHDGAALAEVASMPLGRHDRADLVDRRLHRAVQGDRSLPAGGGRDLAAARSGTAPSTSRRCARWRRSRRSRPRARRPAASGRRAAGSTRSTARCSRPRRSRRRRRGTRQRWAPWSGELVRRAGPTTATAGGTGTPPPRSSGPPEQVVRQRVRGCPVPGPVLRTPRAAGGARPTWRAAGPPRRRRADPSDTFTLASSSGSASTQRGRELLARRFADVRPPPGQQVVGDRSQRVVLLGPGRARRSCRAP